MKDLEFIPACREPLSADVGIIRGKKRTWLLDVGNSEMAKEKILELPEPKSAILSHFHADHIGNLKEISDIELFVGKNTWKYTKCGTIVEEEMVIEDGVHLCILPIPSSHAKGSLGVEVEEKYFWMGDAIWPLIRKDQMFYNAQLLLAEIRLLGQIRAPYLVHSHHMGMFFDREKTVEVLKQVYDRREKDEVLIPISEQFMQELLKESHCHE